MVLLNAAKQNTHCLCYNIDMTTRKTNTKTSLKKTSSTSGSKTKIIAGAIGIAVVAGGAGYAYNEISTPNDINSPEPSYTVTYYKLRKAKSTLAGLEVRATDEAPEKYNSNGFVPSDWADANNSGCRTRYDVLFGSLANAKSDGTKCGVQSGELFDYYTGKTISYADGIDIDHIVAKKNAWDSGGYLWDKDAWVEYANDAKRVLIATSDSANRSKGGKDAADWLPENEEYWCKYVIQQIEIKKFYDLSVRQVEKDKMSEVLNNNCKAR